MKLFLLPVLLSAVLIFSACGGSNTTTKIKKIKAPVKIGIYDFSLIDSVGIKLADGTLNFKSADKNKITGVYDVTNQYADNIPGLFNKSGDFEAQYSLELNKISVNMSPKIADANLFLHGDCFQDSIIGSWNYSTMRGPLNTGVFKAFYRK